MLIPLLFGILILDDSISLDEMDLRKVGSAAQYGECVVLNGIRGMELPLLHFSFKTKQAKEIKDGRIRAMLPFIGGHSEGFVLLNVVGRMFIDHLDADGTYLKTDDITAFKRPNEHVSFAQFTGEGFLTTITSKDHTRLVFIPDGGKEVHELTTHLNRDASRRFWVQFNQAFYSVTKETGELVRLNARFEPVDTLIKGIEPVANPHDKRTPYYSVLSNPISHDTFLSFAHIQVRDPFGNLLPEPIQGSMLFTRNNPRVIQEHVLGVFNDEMLTYDPREQTFSIQPKPAGLF